MAPSHGSRKLTLTLGWQVGKKNLTTSLAILIRALFCVSCCCCRRLLVNFWIKRWINEPSWIVKRIIFRHPFYFMMLPSEKKERPPLKSFVNKRKRYNGKRSFIIIITLSTRDHLHTKNLKVEFQRWIKSPCGVITIHLVSRNRLLDYIKHFSQL